MSKIPSYLIDFLADTGGVITETVVERDWKTIIFFGVLILIFIYVISEVL